MTFSADVNVGSSWKNWNTMPTVLLADEPTGNLDSRTSHELLEVLGALVRDGQTVVMVTHERDAMRFASRTVTLADGRVVTNELMHA